jgi:transglutaminase-like putative cysteine protease
MPIDGQSASGNGPSSRFRDANRIVSRLKLYFAMLSCFGGLVLAVGQDTESIPVIAVFFSIFGYIFVDWLKLFALPPIAAYAAMALAAVYAVSDFADLSEPGNHQMIAVAQLLVFVQAILMLQRKSRRIFEQLGVFCLLELVVAAVFNNAINYGLLLIPITIIGACALSLLAALSASEGLEVLGDLERDHEAKGFRGRTEASSISISAPESVQSLAAAAVRLPRVALLTLAPSVLLVGAIFFYALPRTTDAARVQGRGNAVVGFSDKLHLEQIGQMLQNTQPVLRLDIKDRSTGRDYRIRGGVYLRGRVLEQYESEPTGRRQIASWESIAPGLITGSQTLPSEYFPVRSTDNNFYDSVLVSVVCEPMRSRSLFAIAPYHRVMNNQDIVHFHDRWTIARRAAEDWVFPRIKYSFGTHAFRQSVQTDLTVRWSKGESVLSPTGAPFFRDSGNAQQKAADYNDELLEYDIDAIPTAANVAENLSISPDGKRLLDYQLAKAMEHYLASTGLYSYTLNLNAESLPGVDPIEQFLAVDKKGHCQYYASALVMMLRSQNIPSRVVVGYHTDEYNELGRHYVARQLHAHAWVEALIDRDQLPNKRIIYGQPSAQQYWLRLDPTPSGGRARDPARGVVQMLDMAQIMWDDYVVDMDSGRQNNALLGGRVSPMSQSYELFVEWLSLKISRIRAGELGGGALASRDLFSWPAAVLGVVMTLVVAVLLRLKIPARIRGRMRRNKAGRIPKPNIQFYAETLDQLARVGIARQASQTPTELETVASDKLAHPMVPSITAPLQLLTSTYYQLRFGSRQTADAALENRGPIEHARQRSSEVVLALEELTQSVDLLMVNSNDTDRAT